MTLPTGRICVTGAEPSLAQVADRIRALPEASRHEVRVDLLEAGAPADLASLPARDRLIVTCRRAEEGGRFQGADADQVAWLRAALAAGVAAVDVEAAAPEPVWRALADVEAPRLIASVHVHETGRCTDAALAASRDRLAARPAAVLKLAVATQDVCELGPLRRLEAPAHRPLVRIGMGRAGQVGRACPRALHSAWTYVTAPDAPGTAPGQLDYAALARFPDADPGLLVLLGGPQVAHSPGPRVYTRLAVATGQPLVYLPAPTADVVRAVRELEAFGLVGASVTMPHKAAVAPVARAQGFARRVGAINTLVRTPDGAGWLGENTDGLGVLHALSPALAGGVRQVLVLGTGGAARAAAFAVAEAGHRVAVAGRNPASAAALARDVGGPVVPWDERAAAPFEVLINATPVGADGQSSPVPVGLAWQGRTVLDMLLHPRQTALLRDVTAGGGVAVSGLAMWVGQGAAQWARWTGEAVAPERLLGLVDPEET